MIGVWLKKPLACFSLNIWPVLIGIANIKRNFALICKLKHRNTQ